MIRQTTCLIIFFAPDGAAVSYYAERRNNVNSVMRMIAKMGIDIKNNRQFVVDLCDALNGKPLRSVK